MVEEIRAISMRFHRIQNPTALDDQQIAALLESGVKTVVVQFSESSAYSGKLLRELNRLCERFGARLNVRFYAHYGSQFDCRNLSYLPSVRSLNLDCLMKAVNLEFLYELPLLEEFAFGIFEADLPRLLENKAFCRVRRLVLVETRKKNIDLAPLASYSQLEALFLNGHSRHIEAIALLPSLQSLSLSGIGKSKSLGFIGSIAPLRSLTYLLGGRDDVDDLAHEGLENLELLRVLGLSDINLKIFPSLQRLRIEDQLRLQEVDVRPLYQLRRLSIFNCKNLTKLVGIDAAQYLESLRIGMTAIELDGILDSLPASLQALSLHSTREKTNEQIQRRVSSLGLPAAFYIGAP